MRTFFLGSLVFLLLSFETEAQQLFAKAGVTVSNFDYQNSQGEPLSNLLSVSNGHIAAGYREGLDRNDVFFLRLQASYVGYGAIGSDTILDNFFEYDLNYVGVGVGLDVRLFSLRDFNFLFTPTLSGEYLLRGTQTLNNQVFDLRGQEEFQSFNFFLRLGAEGQYPVSRSSKLTLGYNYGRSLGIISQGDDETLNINTHQFSIGLLINLPSCNCDY